MKTVKNKLRVTHYPQIPCEPFIIDVKDEYEAKKIMEVLAEQHLFLFNKNIIPDYCNVITVDMWEDDSDGDGNPGWTSYWNEEECMEWEELDETYLQNN